MHHTSLIIFCSSHKFIKIPTVQDNERNVTQTLQVHTVAASELYEQSGEWRVEACRTNYIFKLLRIK